MSHNGPIFGVERTPTALSRIGSESCAVKCYKKRSYVDGFLAGEVVKPAGKRYTYSLAVVRPSGARNPLAGNALRAVVSEMAVERSRGVHRFYSSPRIERP